MDRRVVSSLDLDSVQSHDDLVRELDALRRRAAQGTGKAKLSLSDLAERVGLPRSTMHNYMTGRTLIPVDVLDRLVISLGAAEDDQARWAEAWFRVTGATGGRAANAAPLLVPRQLPPATRLHGREVDVEALAKAVQDNDDEVVRPVVLVGPGGAGKTVLAVAVAHAVSGAFPDGQVYVDLRGAHPDPVDSHVVAGRILRALGVPGPQVPDDPDERLGMYRSALAGKRVLLLFDDAADERQVRPLLPASPTCGVLITSRRAFGGLFDAVRWSVSTIADADALALFARLLGPDRVAAEPGAAARILHLCGNLPLAVCVAASRLATHPDWTLAEFEQRLTEVRGRLDELAHADLDVRATLALSYQLLDDRARRLFRLLGLIRVATWPAWVAGELLGAPAHDVLDRLVEVHLVEPAGRDGVGQARYQLHDLLADFARERCDAEEPAPQREAAANRLVAGWLALAGRADKAVPHGTHYADGLTLPDRPGGAIATLDDEWFQLELPGLLAAFDDACERGVAELAGPLSLCLSGFMTLRAYDAERERMFRRAAACELTGPLALRVLSAWYEACAQLDHLDDLPGIAEQRRTLARRLGDREAEVEALWQAGRAARMLGDFGAATEYLVAARDAARAGPVNDQLLAGCLTGLANVYFDIGETRRALPLYEEALTVLGPLRDSREGALVLHRYAEASVHVGLLDQADRILDEAMRLTTSIGDDTGTAYMELVRADQRLRAGQLAEAAELVDQVLVAARVLDNGYLRAAALRTRGEVALAEERYEDATSALDESLAVWQEIGAPIQVLTVLARLQLARGGAGDVDGARRYERRCAELMAELGVTEAALGLR
ncbi:ATP-binding protein [Labedaea rhizosphaerae]|uniref:Putative ATPase n=1 Tax=Labedaea rhizosphaerae TaxID=598644 RepID=A0A4R6SFK9_LABRH|nr:NB-ARC domain-containing protein [Labedaea rhizosphaerae]TDQ00802.1 putative ATPase [Labedaea rhizosphaerae]